MQNLLRKFDLFIFDWDGTLSTSTFLVSMSNLIKRRYKPWYIREHMEEFRKRVMDSENVNAEAEKHKLYDLLYEGYSIFVNPRLREGVIPMLKTLERSRKKTALFTDSKKYRAMKEAKKLGVVNYFDLIMSSETVHAYKPNPTGIEMILKRMRVKKERSIYLGDMASDIITAQLAGITSCGIAGGLNSYSDLREAKPDYLFESIEEFSRNLM